MNYKEKATILRVCSSKEGERCSRCPAFGQGNRHCRRNAMRDASVAITDLLARAEVAEARAEKAERERDAAVKTIFEYTGCPECKHWNGEDEWCEKHDREAGAEDGCSTPEWRGQKEE